MGTSRLSAFLCFFCLALFHTPTFAVKKSYVVYLGAHSHGLEATSLDYEIATESHYDLLGTYLGSKQKAEDAVIYSYTKHINGFAAYLEEEEAAEIAKHPNVISVFPNRIFKLQTTRSWKFLGLERDGLVPEDSLWQKARYGEDVIIGNLDTGVWPESKSFNDEGMGPIPSRWKGICQNHTTVKCNRKLIGLRYYNKGIGGDIDSSQLSPRDFEGHGTHTLSTAGGSFVHNASILGFANGTAKGGSPKARVAAYKVCWPKGIISQGGCSNADLLAAFDQAIDDGVDVLSVSVGGDPSDYFSDGIAIGSFHAVKNGITVVCSAGNSGPTPGTVSNIAPWILTVGASTLDRRFPAIIKLGNHIEYMGQSLSDKRMPQKFYPMIDSAKAYSANSSAEDARLCVAGSLDPKKVKGKVVVCLRGENARVEKGVVVQQAGGVAMILANDISTGGEVLADPHFLPATHINYHDGRAIYKYLNSTKKPVAYLMAPKTQLGYKPAPFMAAFSSRGPNTINEEILKPDITAPGVSVLAAFTEAVGASTSPDDHRRVSFNIMSGTSMSCPHISGIVGLLKTLHPDWSPSAIRSAIMTSSRSRSNMGNPVTDSDSEKATPLEYGAGHVRPNRAMDPGLVYDLKATDYLNFLCKLGYNSSLLSSFTKGHTYTCPSKPPSILDLNYPSITVPNLNKTTTVTRTLKNVGTPGMYKVQVVAPYGSHVSVEPKELVFHKIGEEKSYKLTLVPRKGIDYHGYSFGRISWSDGVHFVRSPITISL